MFGVMDASNNRAPVGSQLVHENCVSCKVMQTQTYFDNGKVLSFDWGAEIKGWKGARNVMGTKTTIVGKTPYLNKTMFALPNESEYWIRFYTDHEMDVEIFTNGIDEEHSQGVFRIMSGVSNWIKRSANVDREFMLFKPDSDLGKSAGIKNDEYSGVVMFKAMPITEKDTNEYKSNEYKSNEYKSNEYKSNETSVSDVVKYRIKNYEHLIISVLLTVSDEPETKYSSAYGQTCGCAVVTRNDFKY